MVFCVSCLLPDLSQLPHIVLAALAIASVVRFRDVRYQRCCGILFHAVAGVILLVMPGLIHAPELIGEFNPVHVFLQRLSAAFFLGYAVFNFRCRNDIIRMEPVVHFTRALTAYLLVVTHLTTAYQLYEDKSRGLHASPHFLGCVLLFYGVWFAVELYQIVQHIRVGDAIEIDLMMKRTQRWIDGRVGGRCLQSLFWIDSALGFWGAFHWLTFPGQIFSVWMRREFPLDGIHVLYARSVACHLLGSAVMSIMATQFAVQHQFSYLIQRIVTIGVFASLQLYGHLISDIYAMPTLAVVPILIIVISYVSILVKTATAMQKEGAATGGDINGPNQTSITMKRTTKVA